LPPLGPVDPARSAAAAQILPIARRAAAKAGVTRLAEVPGSIVSACRSGRRFGR
jgi:hypothetical protein